MIYAQLTNGVIANIIELDDPTLLPLFAEGYDGIPVQIDNLAPIPSIGWIYAPYNHFNDPNTTQVIITNNTQIVITDDVEQGNYIILQYSKFNTILGINAAGQTSAFLTYNANLFTYLSFGYLLDAIAEINTMIADTSDTKTNLSPFVDNDNLTIYKYQIQDWLEIPNT